MGWMDDPEIPAAKPAKRAAAAPVNVRAIASEEGASAPVQAVTASIYQ